MDKLRAFNLGSDLLLKQIYSDLEIGIHTVNHEDGDFGIILSHRDERYERGSEHLAIYTFHSDEEIMRTFEYMKQVIAGEVLITDE
ncbi:hypothetical protein P3U62_08405 [Mammaliicoccus vitulinus]|uniref:hypothetical protein n=1 Tax=Mammaliicoccus vitulinus TaxID=71237 RepID=UPI002B25FC51|nr:hypothetical protein [Mammaliicoccus vitulinus]WQK87071.1 hypothetical protein P3U62_08405 [Mammaliicoccus vitulinus]